MLNVISLYKIILWINYNNNIQTIKKNKNERRQIKKNNEDIKSTF